MLARIQKRTISIAIEQVAASRNLFSLQIQVIDKAKQNEGKDENSSEKNFKYYKQKKVENKPKQFFTNITVQFEYTRLWNKKTRIRNNDEV